MCFLKKDDHQINKLEKLYFILIPLASKLNISTKLALELQILKWKPCGT